MKNLFFLSVIIMFLSCQAKDSYDLIIREAIVLDVESGEQHKGVSVYVRNGIISAIQPGGTSGEAKKIIDAHGRLLTPSFIDTHIHPVSEFTGGKYGDIPDSLLFDSLQVFRKKLTEAFLPFGTTTVMMMGHPDTWTDPILQWSFNPQVNYVDVYTCGAALATEDGNNYPGHYRLANPVEAKKKVLSYYEKGVRHLKMYWRLQEPEFKAVQQTGDSLNLTLFAHTGGFFNPDQMNIFQAIDFGVRNFEHISVLPCSVLDREDWQMVEDEFRNYFGDINADEDKRVLIYILETFRQAKLSKNEDMLRLIEEMAKEKCTISTTIGWVYQSFNQTFFSEAAIKNLTEQQHKRCQENFDIMMVYLQLIHQSGIPIRIGSDTNPGGKMLLLELQLLSQYGTSVEDVFKMASINGAEAIGIEDITGSIARNKKANFILWAESPLDDPSNFTGKKDVFKDGILY